MTKQLTQSEALNLQINLMRYALEILEAKRKDYSGDIDPFGNFRSSTIHGVESWRGVLVRLEDKFARVRNILERGGVMNVEEKFIDTFADMFNYIGIFAGLTWEELELTELLERIDYGTNPSTINP